MIFKPKWYCLLRPECRPHKNKIARLEALRKQYNISHDYFMILILGRPTTTIQVQKALLEQARKEKINVSEKELWKTILRSRLSTAINTGFLLGDNEVLNMLKIDVDGLDVGKSRDELNKELQERVDKIVEKVIKKCKSFEDVCKYIVEFDKKINKHLLSSPIEKIIDEILEDKNDELQKGLKIGNFTIFALAIFVLLFGILLFAITGSLVITGALLLFTGIAFLIWFNSNIRKEELFRPRIFGNFQFITSFPKLCTSLIIIGIVVILLAWYYKQHKSISSIKRQPVEHGQKDDYKKSREDAIKSIENLPEGEIKNMGKFLLLIGDFESRTKKYVTYMNTHMKWNRWTKMPTTDKKTFLLESDAYLKSIQQFLEQSEVIYKNLKEEKHKELIKPFLEYFRITIDFAQRLANSYTEKSYEYTITLVKQQEKINLEWRDRLKPLILKISILIANERKKHE